MSMSKICPALMISAGLLLGGCTSIKQHLSPAETGAADADHAEVAAPEAEEAASSEVAVEAPLLVYCLLYTSDAADE